MNYRHEFHAGNFADVFKHIVLLRIVEHLKKKDKAFRIYDTHAGSGRYELPDANKRNHRNMPPEWVDGVGRLDGWKPSQTIANLVADYLTLARDRKTENGAREYPGSPLLAFEALRKKDRLSVCELHPEAYRALSKIFEGNHQVKTFNLDGWLITGSQIPPKEKRGMILIDPPFEVAGDFWRMAEAVSQTSKRWMGGTVALWYPLKFQADVKGFKTLLIERNISDLICIEIEISRPSSPPKLYGCGMIIRNAPYLLADEMRQILSEIAPLLAADGENAKWSVERLTNE